MDLLLLMIECGTDGVSGYVVEICTAGCVMNSVRHNMPACLHCLFSTFNCSICDTWHIELFFELYVHPASLGLLASGVACYLLIILLMLRVNHVFCFFILYFYIL